MKPAPSRASPLRGLVVSPHPNWRRRVVLSSRIESKVAGQFPLYARRRKVDVPAHLLILFIISALKGDLSSAFTTYRSVSTGWCASRSETGIGGVWGLPCPFYESLAPDPELQGKQARRRHPQPSADPSSIELQEESRMRPEMQCSGKHKNWMNAPLSVPDLDRTRSAPLGQHQEIVTFGWQIGALQHRTGLPGAPPHQRCLARAARSTVPNSKLGFRTSKLLSRSLCAPFCPIIRTSAQADVGKRKYSYLSHTYHETILDTEAAHLSLMSCVSFVLGRPFPRGGAGGTGTVMHVTLTRGDLRFWRGSRAAALSRLLQVKHSNGKYHCADHKADSTS